MVPTTNGLVLGRERHPNEAVHLCAASLGRKRSPDSIPPIDASPAPLVSVDSERPASRRSTAIHANGSAGMGVRTWASISSRPVLFRTYRWRILGLVVKERLLVDPQYRRFSLMLGGARSARLLARSVPVTQRGRAGRGLEEVQRCRRFIRVKPRIRKSSGDLPSRNHHQEAK
jgi:hypothetical protein